MKETGMLFKAEMVRAILEGRKTQTRRLVFKFAELNDHYALQMLAGGRARFELVKKSRKLPLLLPIIGVNCRYGQPGDRPYVKETWGPCDGGFCYRASEHPNAKPDGGKWHPSIFMPKYASRITLEITDVRVERLMDISEEDARAEGVNIENFQSRTDGIRGRENRIEFAALWDSINKKKAPWASSPWVWVITFKKLCGP